MHLYCANKIGKKEKDKISSLLSNLEYGLININQYFWKMFITQMLLTQIIQGMALQSLEFEGNKELGVGRYHLKAFGNCV